MILHLRVSKEAEVAQSMWSFVAIIAGVVLLLVILWDIFVTIVLPRTVRRNLGLTRPFLRSAWKLWSSVAIHIKTSNRRELLLSTFAPASGCN